MDRTNFLELIGQFEIKLKDEFKFELLELHYLPYAFGYGMTAYRISGRLVKVVCDAKDFRMEIFISGKHEKYANVSDSNWTNIFSGTYADFADKAITQLKNKLL